MQKGQVWMGFGDIFRVNQPWLGKLTLENRLRLGGSWTRDGGYIVWACLCFCGYSYQDIVFSHFPMNFEILYMYIYIHFVFFFATHYKICPYEIIFLSIKTKKT